MVYYGARGVVQEGEWIGSVASIKVPPIVQPYKTLVGVIEDFKGFVIASDLTDPNEFKLLYKNYKQGEWANIDFFKVSTDKLLKCPDTGKVSIGELEKILNEKRKRIF